ncbi:MAG: hypothetical protein JWN03_522 [Nocardia sp.]|uniref:hypothetical protein n=1 Tax=Nocardia sp. TaxID=1821 RepID=UPI00261E3E15|nr:hypothetical protein [Nocardia sp.]MCU1640247.1 hypothetical protein [Nocardia sp.]
MKRSLLIGIAGATIALGTVASASAAPLPLENPAPVTNSGSVDSGSTAMSNGSATIASGDILTGMGQILVGVPLSMLCSFSSGGKTSYCLPT